MRKTFKVLNVIYYVKPKFYDLSHSEILDYDFEIEKGYVKQLIDDCEHKKNKKYEYSNYAKTV